jgi:FkbM family methyltransferase
MELMRRVLKTISRDVILTRRLPAEFGRVPILVSPDCALSYWKRDIRSVDPHLLSMARELVRPGMTIWDIGANVGLFAFAAAGLGAQVLAVEGDTWLANLLHRSVAINHLPVTVLPAAVAESSGIGRLHLSEDGRASNSLASSDESGQTVMTVTLDWILEHYPAPQLIKIDIEGMEYPALRGANKTLELKPTLLCEVTQNHEDIGGLLTSAGYTMYPARRKDRFPLKRPSVDTLAVARDPLRPL